MGLFNVIVNLAEIYFGFLKKKTQTEESTFCSLYCFACINHQTFIVWKSRKEQKVEVFFGSE